MTLLKTHDHLALRLLMTEDLYQTDQPVKNNILIEEPVLEASSFDYEGENNKFILILVDDEKHRVISPADRETLTAVLAAKKLELRDVAIVNYNKYPGRSFTELKQFFSCSSIVLFGINPERIMLKDTGSNELTIYEGVKVLATYSFDEMKEDTAKKRVFWNEMKKI